MNEFKFTKEDILRIRAGERINKVANERHVDRIFRDYQERIKNLKS